MAGGGRGGGGGSHTAPTSPIRDEMPSTAGGARYLQAKIRIGSCKGPISYAHNQNVFHHDDVPVERRERKQEVRAWARSQILSIDRRPWTKTTKPDVPVCERRAMENFVFDRSLPYQINFRAETLETGRMTAPVDKPTKFHISRQLESEAMRVTMLQNESMLQRGQYKRTQEMPVHPNLIDALAWNNSNAKVPPAELQKSLDRMTAKSKKHTSKISETLGQTSLYVKPIDNTRNLIETIRHQKRTGEFSPEKMVNVKAEEPVNRKLLKNRQAIEPSRKYGEYYHTGVWELSKADGRYMWSDTGSFVYESKGDAKRIHNPDAYNLEGPTQHRAMKKRDTSHHHHNFHDPNDVSNR